LSHAAPTGFLIGTRRVPPRKERTMETPESDKDQLIIVPPEYIIIRPAEERDIPHIINLLKLNYGDDYPDRELYDPKWVKRAILNENVHWLVAEDTRNGEVLVSGAIKLDYGDYDDQLGIIGRLVARPKRGTGTLKSLGSGIVSELVKKAKTKVECIIGDARTEELASQRMVEQAGLKAVGFLPNYKIFKKLPESLVVYTDLYGGGPTLRSNKLPQVVEEIEPLASHALSELDLPKALAVVKNCPPYPAEFTFTFTDGDQDSLTRLRQIARDRPGDPVVFANVTSNYGMAVLADKKVYHRMAIVDQQIVGAFGYKSEENNQIFQITELIFKTEEIINSLCAEAVNVATEKKARVIEVDLSAYDARIQQTFLDHGFHPVAYIPAMVCHNNSRLDVVKMIKLNTPYSSSTMKLTKKAQKVVSLIEGRLK
jgi:hypothetical protein